MPLTAFTVPAKSSTASNSSATIRNHRSRPTAFLPRSLSHDARPKPISHFAHRRHDHSKRRIYCSSAEPDTHKQPEQFMRAMVGYLMMSNTELWFCSDTRKGWWEVNGASRKEAWSGTPAGDRGKLRRRAIQEAASDPHIATR